MYWMPNVTHLLGNRLQIDIEDNPQTCVCHAHYRHATEMTEIMVEVTQKILQ